MARKLRYMLPELPCHVVQRGVNRQHCFLQPQDYAAYLCILAQSLKKYDVKLYAYVLMGNHTHLLLKSSTEQGIPCVMQQLGAAYARYFNLTQDRSGALFEGRYHASLIDSERYLLSCYRYIELNPVRAGMVSSAADYYWSSYQANALGKNISFLSTAPEYLALGQTQAQRCIAYAALCQQETNHEHVQQLRLATQRNKPFGSETFIQQLEKKLQINLSFNLPGRPRKNGVRGL